jgi:uncharacterized membrane protein YoaK (UPF0700 family)
LDAFHPPCRLDIVTEKPRVGIVRNYVSHPAHGPLPALLLALTVVTGLVDAVSIIALGRVFVANMTGNIVFAGFALAGVPGYSGWGSVFALIGFVTGATGGAESSCFARRETAASSFAMRSASSSSSH